MTKEKSMDKETLIKATDAVKQYPQSFIHEYYVVDALQIIDDDIAARTDATDTLSVSVPTSALEDLSKLEWLPFVEDKNVSIEGDRLIFDWFTMPEDKTGFGIVAAEFVESLISALDAIDDPNPYSEELIAAMEDVRNGVNLLGPFKTMEEYWAALNDDEE